MSTHPSQLGALPWQSRVRRLDSMAQMASATREIRTLALGIVRELGLKPSPASMADALQDWVASHIAFIPETYEVFLSPQEVVEVGASDCDGHASLLAALFLAVGIPAQIAGFGEAGQEPSHVAVLGWIDGQWWTFDSTTDGILESCMLPNGQSRDFAPPAQVQEELGGWDRTLMYAFGGGAILEGWRLAAGEGSWSDFGLSLLVLPDVASASWGAAFDADSVVSSADFSVLNADLMTMAQRVGHREEVVSPWTTAARQYAIQPEGRSFLSWVAGAAKRTVRAFSEEVGTPELEPFGEALEARLLGDVDEAIEALRSVSNLDGYNSVKLALLARQGGGGGGRFGQQVTVVPTYASPGYPRGLEGLISLEEWGIYSREGRLNWLEENGYPLHYGYHHVNDPNQVPVILPRAIEGEMNPEGWGMMGLTHREDWLEARGLPRSWADARNLPEMQPRGFGDLTLVLPLYPSEGYPQGLAGFISLEEWTALPSREARVAWLEEEGHPLHYGYHYNRDPYRVPVILPEQARGLIGLEVWGEMSEAQREAWLQNQGMPKNWADARNLPEMQPTNGGGGGGIGWEDPGSTRREVENTSNNSEGSNTAVIVASVVGAVGLAGVATYALTRPKKGGR